MAFYASSALAFLAIPQLALAEDFDTAADFQTELLAIVASGTGSSTLTYTGVAEQPMTLATSLTTPGTNQSLVIDLGASALSFTGATETVTFGEGTEVKLGMSGGKAKIQIGADGAFTNVVLSGGEIKLGSQQSADANGVFIGVGSKGRLTINDSGTLKMGAEADAVSYTRLVVGRNGGTGELILDDGSIVFGAKGASIQIGDNGAGSVSLSGTAIIDSSDESSNLWVGIGSAGVGTLTIEDSAQIQIHGSAADRFFMVGRDGGTGVVTQSGASSHVHLSGLTLIGLGEGTDGHGTYNLQGGLLEVGTEELANSFWVGVGYEGSARASEAYFNVSGGEARLHGNLEIANTGNWAHPESIGIVTITGGLVSVGRNIVFGAGEGSLVLKGGVLELGGTNAIRNSGDIEFNGGTLRASSDLTIASNAAAEIKAGGITFDSDGHSITYNAVLSGAGKLTKSGEGVLVLGAANTYAGGTSVDAGTLDARTAGGLGSGQVALNGGTLMLAEGSTLTNALVASSTGKIDLGGGAVTLSGARTGSGEITYSNGSVILNSASTATGTVVLDVDVEMTANVSGALAAGTALVMGEGSTLSVAVATEQAVGSLSGAGTLNLAGTLAIAASDEETVFAGTLKGTPDGVLYKTGAEHVILNLNGDYAGLIVAGGGSLALQGVLGNAHVEIASGATFGGNGTVASISGSTGGIVSPGNSIGTLTVAGEANFDGLTYLVEIEGTASDLIAVVGTAFLTGGKVEVAALGDGFSINDTYTILTAAALDGAFDTEVISNLTYLDAKLTYPDLTNAVELSFERSDVLFAEAAETENQAATAAALDTIDMDGDVFDAIVQLDAAGITEASDALSGEVHASVKTGLIEDSRVVRGAFNDRLRASTSVSDAKGGSRVWALGFASNGETEGDGNAAALKRSGGGILAGVDASLESWQIGAALGASNSTYKLADRGSSAEIDTMHFGLYGGNTWDNLGLRLGLVYSSSSVETTRTAAFADFSETLTGSYDATALHLFGELGYKVATARGSFEPFVNLAHVRLKTKGFAEAGGDAALASAGDSSETNFATLGVHAAGSFDLSGIPVSARGTLAWQQGMGDTALTNTHRFNTGSEFTVAGTPLGKSAAIIEAGLDFAVSPGATLSVSYGGAFASDSHDHRGQIGLNVRF